jgi:hypothetical protein
MSTVFVAALTQVLIRREHHVIAGALDRRDLLAASDLTAGETVRRTRVAINLVLPRLRLRRNGLFLRDNRELHSERAQ